MSFLLVVALLASLVMAPPPATTQHGVFRKQVAVALDREVAQGFLDCVCAIPNRHYRITVLQGWTVVIPNANRDLDFETTDRALLECVQNFAEDMLIQMGSRSSGQAEYRANGEPVSVFEVEVDDLVRLGAKSIEYVTEDIPDSNVRRSLDDAGSDGHELSDHGASDVVSVHAAAAAAYQSPPDLTPSQIFGRGAMPEAKRDKQKFTCCGISKASIDHMFRSRKSSLSRASHAKRWPHQDQYYCTFPSEYTGCRDLDLQTHQYRQCYSVWSPFWSILAANSHGDRMLKFTVWPHHHCERGNIRVFIVPTNALSICIEGRATFSHDGDLLGLSNTDEGGQRKKSKSEVEQEAARRSQEAARNRKEHKLNRARSFGKVKPEAGAPPSEMVLYRYCPWIKFLTASLTRQRSQQLGYGRNWGGQSQSRDGRSSRQGSGRLRGRDLDGL